MTAKERVQAALALQPTDVIPYGEFAIDGDTAAKILGHETYYRSKAKCKIALWEGRRDEVLQSWKEDIVALYKQLDMVDIVNLSAEASGILPPKNYQPERPKKTSDNTWEDDLGRIYKYSESTQDITMIHDPDQWEREFAPEDFALPPDAVHLDDSIFEVVDHVIRELNGEKFVIGPAGNEAGMVLLGGFQRGLTEYASNPEAVAAACHYYAALGDLEDAFYIRKGVDAVLWGQDFSYNSGCLISPEAFREICLPSIKSRVKHVREAHGLPVIKHGCGNNSALLGMFDEAGYCALQSIQESAGVRLEQLKAEVGSRFCLWGGIAVESLIGGTTDEVRALVRQAAETAREGGVILGSSHSIAVGSKYENVMALFEEISKLRCSL